MSKILRINKYLSLCGLGARRKVEDFILNKKIKLNGEVVHSLSQTVDIENDIVEYDNVILTFIDKRYFIILNKPKGYVTTVNDEHKRPIVMDLIPEKFKRAMVVPVGRLDSDSEGLLLMTNDGDIAYKLTHPKFGIEKAYIVELDNPLQEPDKKRIEKGIFLYGEKTNPAKIDFLDSFKKMIKITITEGKKRHIRLTFKKFSYKVKKLKRVSFGPIQIGNLYSGSYRMLRKDEIRKLLKAVDM